MEEVWELQYVLDEYLLEPNEVGVKNETIEKHIRSLEARKLIAEDFGNGMEWLNTAKELSLHKDFKGKIVILDFFTYCCINCIHLLPTLHQLESQFAERQEVVIIGVHSAKFDNERSSINVAQAVLRYDISHCVVNDPTAVLWEKFKIFCWPTLVILGPDLQVIFTLAGESAKDKLYLFVDQAVKYFSLQNRLSSRNIPMKLLKESADSSFLSYPGKIAFEPLNQLIIISDSGHHRIVIATKEGLIQDVVGGIEKGFVDGTFASARFNHPQGVCCWGQYIFVADTVNNCIRKVDMELKKVTTVTGTGFQGFDEEGGKVGTEQAISSPWDLCLGSVIGAERGNDQRVLYIAMAGTHQIWALCLEDCYWKTILKSEGTCFAVAGTGKEENRNNCYPMKASFAQPSGLTFARPSDESTAHLYIADSESSAIRSISLTDGSVKAIVGGDPNPMNLFSYGDEDAVGYKAKLQHPMGICYCPKRNKLFVADTYNHKIKIVDLAKKECKTLERIQNMNEPSGLFLLDETLYIADTNNHEIKMYHLDMGESQKFLLIQSQAEKSCDFVDSCTSKICNTTTSASASSVLELPVAPVKIQPGGKLTLILEIDAGSKFSFTEGAPHSWTIIAPNTVVTCQTNGKLTRLENSTLMGSKIDLFTKGTVSVKTELEVIIRVKVFICDKSTGVCLMRESQWCHKINFVGDLGLQFVETSLVWKM